MKNNKNHNLIERSNYEKITHYSIRKVSFGAASVAIAVAFMFLGADLYLQLKPIMHQLLIKVLLQILKMRQLIKFLMLQARTLM